MVAPHPDWPQTCTVGPMATTGERCGRPAIMWFQSAASHQIHAECALHAGCVMESAGMPSIAERGRMGLPSEPTRPEDPGWEHEAMNWSPAAGEREIHAWQDIFHDRRRDA